MKIFVIDSANCAKAYRSKEKARQCGDGTPFSTGKDFATVSKDWPLLRLVAIWNKLPRAKPVRRFTDRGTALRRIWAALQALAPGSGSKTELILGLLRQPSGATLAEIMAATGWQAHYADVRIMPTCAGNPACGAGIAAMESA